MSKSDLRKFSEQRANDVVRLSNEAKARIGRLCDATTVQAVFEAEVSRIIDDPADSERARDALQLLLPGNVHFVIALRMFAEFVGHGGRVAFIEPQEKPK